MDEPLGYFNGQFLPETQLAIPVSDAGFVLGTTVTEQLRTFSGSLFQLDQHLERYYRSLKIVGLTPTESRGDLIAAAEKLVQTNWPLADRRGDLGLALFTTPGPLPSLNGGTAGAACVGLHTYPLPFSTWSEKYHTGQRLVVTEIQQVPSRCWPAELKCRSRMHYFLADRAAMAIDPGARALLLDSGGFVMEASTANILLYRADQGIITPPAEDVLPGISLMFVKQLALQLGIPWNHRPLRCDDVAGAEEVLLSSTPFCLLPVSRFNGQKIAGGQPGSVFQNILQAWSQEVGLDIVAQAESCLDR
jgi:branched-subunit amino acid aminotransferase/4-amino-4-deoxychorismate lyase